MAETNVKCPECDGTGHEAPCEGNNWGKGIGANLCRRCNGGGWVNMVAVVVVRHD